MQNNTKTLKNLSVLVNKFMTKTIKHYQKLHQNVMILLFPLSSMIASFNLCRKCKRITIYKKTYSWCMFYLFVHAYWISFINAQNWHDSSQILHLLHQATIEGGLTMKDYCEHHAHATDAWLVQTRSDLQSYPQVYT